MTKEGCQDNRETISVEDDGDTGTDDGVEVIVGGTIEFVGLTELLTLGGSGFGATSTSEPGINKLLNTLFVVFN